jgi:hypothetical protein
MSSSLHSAPGRTPPDLSGPVPARFRNRIVFILILLLGLIARAFLAERAPRDGYPWDHLDNIGMGLNADQHGLFRIYSIPPAALQAVPGRLFEGGQVVTISRSCDTPPNYPPLGMTLLWLQYKALVWLYHPLIGNTFETRLITAALPTVGDIFTAWGVHVLVMILTARRCLAALAAVMIWLSPPLFMNSTLWGQVDSFMLTPTVWLVIFLVQRQWILAGLCLAAAALLKPQGIILIPITGFSLVVMAICRADAKGPLTLAAVSKTLLATAFAAASVFASALAAVAVITLPWMMFGGLSWLQRCYVMSFTEVFPMTTLQAYNFWNLLALIDDIQPHRRDILDAHAVVAGLSKDAWGRLLVTVALLTAATVAWQRNRQNPAMAVVVFAGLALWSVFQWPTRIHERYVIYCIPLVIVMAAAAPRHWPAVFCLLGIASAEHCWNIWQPQGPTIGAYHHNAEQAYHDILRQYEADVAGVPMAVRPPPPAYEDVMRFLWKRHRKMRSLSESLERILTILSLTAYTWAMTAAAWPDRPRQMAAHPT